MFSLAASGFASIPEDRDQAMASWQSLAHETQREEMLSSKLVKLRGLACIREPGNPLQIVRRHFEKLIDLQLGACIHATLRGSVSAAVPSTDSRRMAARLEGR